MISFSSKREPPWFFQYIENYSHILLDIRFDKIDLSKEKIDFSVQLDVHGFEGLIFYIYKPRSSQIEFDIVNQKEIITHKLENLHLDIMNKSHPPTNIDFIIIPFGYFKEKNKFIPSVRSGKVLNTYQIFAWSPSQLFKNVKSIIKVANKYNEMIPYDDVNGYFYAFDASFKANKTEHLFNLINLLVTFDNLEGIEPIVPEIKQLISKTNEFLFELAQKEIPIEMQNLLRELERLKFNIENLSKEEIFNWLDDLITFYYHNY
jgi:hypothetical protein